MEKLGLPVFSMMRATFAGYSMPATTPLNKVDDFRNAVLVLSGFQRVFPDTPEQKLAFKRTYEKLEGAIKACESVVEHGKINEWTTGLVRHCFSILVEAFNQDCDECEFLVIGELSEYHKAEKPYGEDVYNFYTAHREDIVSASKCLAYGQNLAVIFHLMRVMEAVTQQLGTLLAVITPKPVQQSNWEDILVAIDNQIESSYKKGPQNRKHVVSPLIDANPSKFRDIAMQLRDIKSVWRNPVVHPHTAATSDGVTKDIFTMVGKYLEKLISVLSAIP